jgi:hypothetical protein
VTDKVCAQSKRLKPHVVRCTWPNARARSGSRQHAAHPDVQRDRGKRHIPVRQFGQPLRCLGVLGQPHIRKLTEVEGVSYLVKRQPLNVSLITTDRRLEDGDHIARLVELDLLHSGHKFLLAARVYCRDSLLVEGVKFWIGKCVSGILAPVIKVTDTRGNRLKEFQLLSVKVQLPSLVRVQLGNG